MWPVPARAGHILHNLAESDGVSGPSPGAPLWHGYLFGVPNLGTTASALTASRPSAAPGEHRRPAVRVNGSKQQTPARPHEQYSIRGNRWCGSPLKSPVNHRNLKGPYPKGRQPVEGR